MEWHSEYHNKGMPLSVCQVQLNAQYRWLQPSYQQKSNQLIKYANVKIIWKTAKHIKLKRNKRQMLISHSNETHLKMLMHQAIYSSFTWWNLQIFSWLELSTRTLIIFQMANSHVNKNLKHKIKTINKFTFILTRTLSRNSISVSTLL